jgi:cytochrome c oxidase cbb3-type subunit 1
MSQGTQPAAAASAHYDDRVVRPFALMTIVWGIVGTSVGALLAAQPIRPALNIDLPWLSYGRLRPLHTNAVIFAFGGSALSATSYYIVQRTCHTRLFLPRLAEFTFWGWQLVSVLAAIPLPLGITSGTENAELETSRAPWGWRRDSARGGRHAADEWLTGQRGHRFARRTP